MKLDDLIEALIRNAPDLARAKIDRLAAQKAAEGERRSQAFVATSNFEYKRFAISERVEVPMFSVISEEKIAGGVGIGRNIPTGGNVQLEMGVQRIKSEYLIESRLRDTLSAAEAPAGTNAMGDPYDYAERNIASVRATLKQPLSRGFGPKIALAQQHKADFLASEATIKAQLAGEELVRDAVIAYWDLAFAAFEVDVRTQSLELAKKQEDLTHEQMRAGTAPSSAANAVVYEIQMRAEKLLSARIQLEHKSLELRRKAGLEIGRRDILLRPGEPFVIGEDEFDVDDMLQRSRAGNRKLAAIQLQKKAADVDVAVAKDQTKPQLDATFSGAIIGDGDGVSGALGALADSYEVMVGLQLSFEISGAAGKSRDAAIAKRKRLDVDREDAARQIDTAVVNAVHLVTSARTRVSLAEKAINVAEENVRAERANFMVSRTTNFSVMQRQTELVEARLRFGQAVSDYHKAVAQLQFLSGIILDQYRVNVRPRAAGARLAKRGEKE